MLNNLLNPSTLEGAYFISITSSIFVGFILGKSYEKKMNSINQRGDKNIAIQSSKIKGK